MRHEDYARKRLEKKGRPVHRKNGYCSGMGVRLSGTTPDNLPYPRMKSPKKFIKFSDGHACWTFTYEVFLYYGYGCNKVECIHDTPRTMLERYGDRLHWKER